MKEFLKKLHPQSSLLISFFIAHIFASQILSQDTSETINPTTTCFATRGLTQTESAEALGDGRLTINIQGSYYQQQKEFLLAPNKGSHIITNRNALSFGVNSYIDIFTSLVTFGSINYKSPRAGGFGSVCAGISGTLPFSQSAPIRLGSQVSIIGGTSVNQINTNYADGYNYFETRKGYDFMGKLLQSFLFGTDKQGLKIYCNEGIVTSLQPGKGILLLFAAAIQANLHKIFVLGIEAQTRTPIKDFSVMTNPFWITPSLQFRTPYSMNYYIAGDISVSKGRTDTEARALEPYRILSGLTFTFDLLASKRRAEYESRQKEKQEKAQLQSKAQRLQEVADSIARKAVQDSAELANAMARQQEVANFQKDSIANKMRNDSIMLAQTMQKLHEEKARRSDAEKQLLSTGLLILDAVFFESGKTEISINSKPYLTIIGKMLTKYPKLQLQVAGHTDNIGSYESNMLLSRERAQAVRDFLVIVSPDLSNRLVSVGYGPTRPKAPNNTAEGRKLNRRVELEVLNKEVLNEYNQY